MPLENYQPFPQDIPVIAKADLFLYPAIIVPIFLDDKEDLKAVNYSIENDCPLMICCLKDKVSNSKSFEDFYDAGVVGSIMRKIELPNQKVKILFQGLARGKIVKHVNQAPFIAHVELLKTLEDETHTIDIIMNNIKELVKEFAEHSNLFPNELQSSIFDNIDHNKAIDLIASMLKISKDEHYELFIEEDLEKRLLLLLKFLTFTLQQAKLQHDIKSKVNGRINRFNKEFFLKEQIKQIRKELGEDDTKEEELENYHKLLDKKAKFMNEKAYKEIKKQINRLQRMHPDSSDANTLQTYVEWVLEVPFEKNHKTDFDINMVQKRLDKDHFGLEKPKDRITEFFAVKALLKKRNLDQTLSKGTILCFIGPPGVGKTSLANSIAVALKRSLIRIALGGLEDVNELKGHRRTYVGAMPGRVVQGIIDAGTMNPVIVLDEIDKINRNMRGDPSATLLEILDPEQNHNFRDYYLNFDIDLSNSIFIATANDRSMIPHALQDRLEFIELNSYTPDEKFEIAKKYLVNQELKKHGILKKELSISPGALKLIIERYTREAGVRNLRMQIAKVTRKCAKRLLDQENKISINPRNLSEFLDKEIFDIDLATKTNPIGEVNGLAFTPVGGEVLKVEALSTYGKGQLKVTGSLGNVMQESASIAFSVVKHLITHNKLDIHNVNLTNVELIDKDKDHNINNTNFYNFYDIHLHALEGAIPKDGPSAGITMATAISSILIKQCVRADLAMTGELTLQGKVLPIGGLKEKLIAAFKAKIKTVLIPIKNYQKDLDEIPQSIKEGLEIIAVDHINEVLEHALVK